VSKAWNSLCSGCKLDISHALQKKLVTSRSVIKYFSTILQVLTALNAVFQVKPSYLVLLENMNWMSIVKVISLVLSTIVQFILVPVTTSPG
jgi:hypothetical protein